MMIHKILLATDGSSLSHNAEHKAIGLAHALKVPIVAIHVTPPFHAFTFRPQLVLTYRISLRDDSQEGYSAAVAEAAAHILDNVRHAAKASGVDCTTHHLSADEPWRAIVDAAKKDGCDLIVMASHGHHGIDAVVLGSETQKVLTHSDVPVLVCR
jgi:nucleotide-binding universal stress UspA family protein